jgi:GT2 family glycosyltransferase
MLISVILPTHNRAVSLVRALEALAKQTLPKSDYEVIVVVDSCTDDSAKVATSTFPNFRVIEMSVRSPAKSRNAGARLAKGRYLAFTDDDCEPDPNWLINLLTAFEKEPEAVAVGGRTVTIAKKRTPLTHQIENAGGMDLIPTCNLALRREIFETLGGFSEEFIFPLNEDTDLSWRLEALGPLSYCPAALVIHPPRSETFKAKVRWVRYLESEFILAERYPRLYAERRRSPWYFIYWQELIRSHLRAVKAAFGDLLKRHRPDHCFIRFALIAARSGYLLYLLPRFRVAAAAARKPINDEYAS